MKWDIANTYQEKAGHLLKLGLIGFLIGLTVTFTLLLETGEVLGWLFLGLLFAGIPYGWELTGRFFGVIVGSIPVMVIAFILRLTAAYLLGLFVYPVVLLYNLIRGCIHK